MEIIYVTDTCIPPKKNTIFSLLYLVSLMKLSAFKLSVISNVLQYDPKNNVDYYYVLFRS